MKIQLPSFVGMYEECGPACDHKLVPLNLAIRGEVELWGYPQTMVLLLSGGGVYKEQMIAIRFHGYRRYLSVRELGVELPTGLGHPSQRVEASA